MRASLLARCPNGSLLMDSHLLAPYARGITVGSKGCVCASLILFLPPPGPLLVHMARLYATSLYATRLPPGVLRGVWGWQQQPSNDTPGGVFYPAGLRPAWEFLLGPPAAKLACRRLDSICCHCPGWNCRSL